MSSIVHYRPIGTIVTVGLAAWAGLVAMGASTNALSAVPPPAIAALVALGIAAPTAGYFVWPDLRHWVERVGLRALTALHVWRIGAAILFFSYGSTGQLPAAFIGRAGWGDLVAGLAALVVVLLPMSRSRYVAVHLFGLADFLVAVGTGLYFTLALPGSMEPLRELPLALIPLFGVGLSGATHIMAFDLLRRSAGMKRP